MQFLRKIKSNKTLVNGSLFAVYSFAGKGISFFLLIILANYIKPAEYGQLSLFNTIVTLVGIFFAFSTSGYFGISFFKKDIDGFRQSFTVIFILGLVSLVLFCIPLHLFEERIREMMGFPPLLLWCAIFISFFLFLAQLQTDYCRIRERLLTFGILNVGNAALNFVLSLFFVVALNQNWEGRVYAQLTCALLFGVISFFSFFYYHLFDFRIRIGLFKEVLNWGLPMIPHHATSWLKQGLDRFIINSSFSLYQVGIFSFALNVANIIEMVGVAFNATNSVALFKILSDKELSTQEKKMRLDHQTRMIFMIYLGTAVAVLAGMSIFTYFALSRYKESLPFFVILCVSAFLKCVYFLYCNYLFFYSKTKNLMYITFGSSVLHLVLSLAFTRVSLYCTSFIYIVSQLCMTVIVYYAAKKLLAQNLGVDDNG